MSIGGIIGIVITAIAVLCVIWFIATYNGFVKLRNQVKEAFCIIEFAADIDTCNQSFFSYCFNPCVLRVRLHSHVTYTLTELSDSSLAAV